MAERLKRITPQMDEEDAMGLILDELMDRAEPDVAEAIRLCAIPHWFNEEIIACLRNEDQPSARTYEILDKLARLTFVAPYPERGLAYHKMTREVLLKHWCQKDNARFRSISLRMADYHAAKDDDQQEMIYHLLAAGDERGFQMLDQAITRANRLFQFSTAEHLLNLTAEPCIEITHEQQWRLEFYAAELAAISGRWEQALPMLDQLRERDLPPSLLGRVLARLGTVYQRTGEWEKSIEFYRASLDMGEQVDPSIRAWTYTGLGLLYQRRGELELARECQESAIQVAEQSGDLLWLGRALNNLGEIYQLEGHLDEAHRHYLRSVDTKKQVDDKYGLIWTYINLGALYTDQRDWQHASESLGQGLELARDLGSPPDCAKALYYLGELARKEGRYDRAAERYEQGLAISDEINDVYRRALIQVGMGLLREDQGDYAGALNYLERGLETLRQLKSREADQAEQDVRRVRSRREQSTD